MEGTQSHGAARPLLASANGVDQGTRVANSSVELPESFGYRRSSWLGWWLNAVGWPHFRGLAWYSQASLASFSECSHWNSSPLPPCCFNSCHPFRSTRTYYAGNGPSPLLAGSRGRAVRDSRAGARCSSGDISCRHRHYGAVALIGMPILARKKRAAARATNNRALAADFFQSATHEPTLLGSRCLAWLVTPSSICRGWIPVRHW